MIRAVLALGAFLSVFLFPYPLTALLSFVASLYLPGVALLVGILVDLLYYVPEAAPYGLPAASLFGLFLSLVALVVRRFVRARIIGG